MLTACAMGPDYQRPPIDTGLAYKEVLAASPSSSAAVAASQGWVQAQPGDDALRGDWWQLFNDAVLSDLMQALQASNLSIVQAEAQYRQAQALLQSSRSGFFPTLGASASGTRSGSVSNSGGSFSGGTSEEHTSEPQSLMRISYAVSCLE